MKADISIFSLLKDRDLRREGLLIGEGRFLVERIAASCVPVAGAAIPEAIEELKKLIDGRCPVFEVSGSDLAMTTGFDFHRGMLIAAERPQIPAFTEHPAVKEGRRLLLCAGITDPVNLGSIIRTAAALGWDGVMVDKDSADPFSRRALRCSMGAVLSRQLVYLENPEDSILLKNMGWTLAAAIPGGESVSPETLQSIHKLGLILGNEGFGIPNAWREQCDISVCIPQIQNRFIDSLNVAAAAAILLWEGRA